MITSELRSLTRAFALFGLTSACRPGELRRSYARLAREWHPDRHAVSPEMLSESTARMAELNCAYGVARQHLKRVGSTRGAATAKQQADARGSRSQANWGRTPRMRPPWLFEREAALIPRLAVVVLLTWSVGELARRALPSEWQIWVVGGTVAAIAVGATVVWIVARD